jgi:hypothetical protein
LADNGSGVGTPITGGASTGIDLIEPLPYTLLPLHRYASIMGMNPVHFAQAYDEQYFPMFSTCPDIWYKYGWQKPDYVGRHDLAIAIKNAEEDIARVIGYWPAPMWIPAEEQPYPKFHRREYGRSSWMPDNTYGFKSIKTEFGRVLATGQRAVALAGEHVGVLYSDEDGDGFYETAAVTLDISGSAAETITGESWYESDTCRFGVYYPDHNGTLESQIRPPRKVSLSGTTLTLIFYSWQMVRPDLEETIPQYDGRPMPIEITVLTNLLSEVEVYLEYPDNSLPSVQFIWDNSKDYCGVCGGVGCTSCQSATQGGCLQIIDGEVGTVAPIPSTYDATTGEWNQDSLSGQREPRRVKVWYLSGMLDRDYIMGSSCDPLDDYMAQTIAWLATSRLHKGLCACGNLHSFMDDLRRDMAVQSGEGNFIVVDEQVMRNPFGMRRGEVLAWRRLTKILSDKQISGAAL